MSHMGHGIDDYDQAYIDEVMSKRKAHIEMYSMAFLKEVGSHQASKYVLVERMDTENKQIVWEFVKKSKLEQQK